MSSPSPLQSLPDPGQQPEALLRAVLNSPTVAIVAVGSDGRVKLANRGAERMFGYSSGELLGQPSETLIPDDQPDSGRIPAGRIFANPGEYPSGREIDLIGRHKDGTEFPMNVNLSHIETTQGMLAVALVRDISVRKQLQEERDTFFDISLDPLCIRELNGNFTRVNPAMERLLGWSEAELCSRSYLEFVHPDDHAGTIAAMQGVAEGHPMVDFENRYRSKNGRWLWLHWRAAARNPEQSTVYAAAHDFTEIKQKEAKLRELAGQLIAAREEERRRIASELHDDVTQRLSTLGIELGLLKQTAGHPEVSELRQTLSRLQEYILQLSEDVRKLSHSLHPSILEHASLEISLEILCREFTAQHGILADFTARDVPEELPSPVRVALYRIAQESLQNVARHSGATECRIVLAPSTGGQLSLDIMDNGRGFDSAQATYNPGLGLVSIEERARQVKGSLTIDSVPDVGTRLTVRVPWTKVHAS